MSMDRLIAKVIEKKSHTVVGLDTDYNVISEMMDNDNYRAMPLRERITSKLFDYNKGLIDAVVDHVPSVKIQIAFYERYGLAGLDAYAKTAAYATEAGLYVIGDIKRGDIGSTSEAYAEGHLSDVSVEEGMINDFKVDSITVNPYLGEDSVVPFLKALKTNDASMFVLARTSNPLSGLIQNVTASENGLMVYEKVATWLSDLGKEYIGQSGYSSIGAVVGATHVSEIIKIRELMPSAYFLIPGYGAQGGKAEDLVKGFNTDGLGGVVNSSRGIIYAWQKEQGKDYKTAAKNATMAMNQDIYDALKQAGKLAF